MIVRITIDLGKVVCHIPTSFEVHELLEVREQLTEMVGRTYDDEVQKAKALWKARKRGKCTRAGKENKAWPKKEGTNASKVASTGKMDVGNPSGDGETLGGGNPEGQKAPGEGPQVGA